MENIILSERVNNMAESATLKMTQKSRELKAQGIDIISLSIGEPDFNTPESVKQAGIKAIENTSCLPSCMMTATLSRNVLNMKE